MPLIARKKVILAKAETTYGTDPTPTGGANAIQVRNLNINPQDADFVDRNLVRPYLGRSEQLPAGIRVTMDFEVELQGSGAAGTAPSWGVLMVACGHNEAVVASTSVTYTPVSGGFGSVTIYLNVDGVLHKLTGARGTWSLALKVKDIPTLKFSFTGLYNAVTDAAAPVPAYSTWKTPTTVSNINTTPFTLHGYSAVMSELTIDQSGSLVHRSLVGGSESVLITDREPQGSITIEATTVAQKNWWQIAKDATLGALDITHGITAGLKCKFNAPNVQLTKPTYTDMDGIQMVQMGINLVPGSSGNDDYSFVLT